MAQLEDEHALLIYRVGPVLCCAPTSPVKTLIQPTPLTRPPGSSSSYPGIFHHDGKIVRLIEGRQLFGVAEHDRKQPGRIIVCYLDEKYTGFQVDEVIDVINTPTTGWGQLSPSLTGGVFTRSLLLNDKIYLYTEFETLHQLRNFGFLKPWIEHLQEQAKLHEEKQAEETTHRSNTSPPKVASQASPSTEARKESAPVGASAPSESSTLNAPIEAEINQASTTNKREVADAQPQQAEQDRSSNDEHARADNPHPIRKTKPQKIERNAEIKKQKTTAVISKPAKATEPVATRASTHTSSTQPSVAKTSSRTEKEPATKIKSAEATLPKTPHPASSKQETNSCYAVNSAPDTHKNKTGMNLFFVFIPVFAVGLIVTFFYLWPNNDLSFNHSATNETSLTHAQFKKPSPNEIYTRNELYTPPTQTEKTRDDRTQTYAAANENETTNENSHYHAAIEQQQKEHGNNEITIVLTAPASDKVIRADANSHELKQDTKPHPDLIAIKSLADEIEMRTAQPAGNSTTTQQRSEVVHTVVKGDTLWFIAQRYIHNPFRYPELARLNKIPNPDLIYPGDRVRIIRIHSSSIPASTQ